MKQLDRFLFRFRTPLQLLSIALTVAMGIGLTYLDLSPFLTLILAVFVEVTLYIVIATASARLAGRAAKILNEECDPEPLLDETAYLLSHFRKGNPIRYSFMIDRSTALIESGRREEAYQLLKSIPYQTFLPQYLMAYAIYHHNLYCLADRLGKTDEAEYHYFEARRVFPSVKIPAQRDMLLRSFGIGDICYALRHGDYKYAIDDLLKNPGGDRRGRVTAALLLARAYLMAGDEAAARDRLLYVIREGNKLVDVQDAKALLSTLPAAGEGASEMSDRVEL
ncbi:MAG: hypothetical protein IKC63_00380 [Clostridia bacterium]|nr:hypothetical protein [Clostridia bacterium]